VRQRYQDIYDHLRRSSSDLCHVHSQNKFPVPPLNTLDLEKDTESYLDISLKNYEHYLEMSRTIEDDLIPSMGYFGSVSTALLWRGYLFSRKIPRGAGNTVINDWDDFEKLYLSENNRWVVFMEETLKYCAAVYP
jgi:hypothetical protein